MDDPTSAHSKGIGRQSEFSNRELAEKKFELVYGAATNDWSRFFLDLHIYQYH
jgi:hypothetical protein